MRRDRRRDLLIASRRPTVAPPRHPTRGQMSGEANVRSRTPREFYRRHETSSAAVDRTSDSSMSASAYDYDQAGSERQAPDLALSILEPSPLSIVSTSRRRFNYTQESMQNARERSSRLASRPSASRRIAWSAKQTILLTTTTSPQIRLWLSIVRAYKLCIDVLYTYYYLL